MKKTLLCCLVLCISLTAFGQKYRTAGGLRLGSEIGLTVQQKVLDKTTIEGIFQTRIKTKEINLTLLAERHYKILGKRMNVYLGGGVHKGWRTDSEKTYGDPAGAVGVAGVELTLDRLNISWDFQPAVNIIGGDRFFIAQSAISARYVFVKAKKKKINWKFWKKDGKKKKKRR